MSETKKKGKGKSDLQVELIHPGIAWNQMQNFLQCPKYRAMKFGSDEIDPESTPTLFRSFADSILCLPFNTRFWQRKMKNFLEIKIFVITTSGKFYCNNINFYLMLYPNLNWSIHNTNYCLTYNRFKTSVT